MRKPARGAALIDHPASYCSAPIKTECHHSDIVETDARTPPSWNLPFGNQADVFLMPGATLPLPSATLRFRDARSCKQSPNISGAARPSGGRTRIEFLSHFQTQEQINGEFRKRSSRGHARKAIPVAAVISCTRHRDGRGNQSEQGRGGVACL